MNTYIYTYIYMYISWLFTDAISQRKQLYYKVGNHQGPNLCMYTYAYTYIHIYIYIYIYISIYCVYINMWIYIYTYIYMSVWTGMLVWAQSASDCARKVPKALAKVSFGTCCAPGGIPRHGQRLTVPKTKWYVDVRGLFLQFRENKSYESSFVGPGESELIQPL